MGRPAKGPKDKLVEVPCKVMPEVEKEIARLALATDRSHSQIARKLISRGLAAYKRDGYLDEPSENINRNELAPPVPTIKSIPTEQILYPLQEGQKLSPKIRKGGRK